MGDIGGSFTPKSTFIYVISSQAKTCLIWETFFFWFQKMPSWQNLPGRTPVSSPLKYPKKHFYLRHKLPGWNLFYMKDIVLLIPKNVELTKFSGAKTFSAHFVSLEFCEFTNENLVSWRRSVLWRVNQGIAMRAFPGIQQGSWVFWHKFVIFWHKRVIFWHICVMFWHKCVIFWHKFSIFNTIFFLFATLCRFC